MRMFDSSVPETVPETPMAITLAESLMRLAASSLDEAVGSSEQGGVEHFRKVGAAMGILSYLMHGIVLKRGGGIAWFQQQYENGFRAGLQAGINVEAVFYDE